MVLHRATASAAAVLLVFGLAACGSDPKPSASSHAPEPTASSSPTGPAAPVLPELAREKSARGARAFLDFWFDTVTYAMRTGDTSVLTRNAEPECRGCNNLIRMVGEIRSRRLRQHGGGWFEKQVALDPRVDMPTQRFAVLVHVPRLLLIDQSGRNVQTDKPKQFMLYVTVNWRDGQWRSQESVSV